MHDTTRSGPCGLDDGHSGRHRTIAGAAREAARRVSRHYRDMLARYDNAHPAQAYLRKMRYERRNP